MIDISKLLKQKKSFKVNFLKSILNLLIVNTTKKVKQILITLVMKEKFILLIFSFQLFSIKTF